ncbi:MAG: carbohydrate ABC transporter substrate-binding protein [Clostridiales bacterium]|nr:carbohydrate ABC transporter substrate-binding protein [Clostridiales bacterium]
MKLSKMLIVIAVVIAIVVIIYVVIQDDGVDIKEDEDIEAVNTTEDKQYMEIKIADDISELFVQSMIVNSKGEVIAYHEDELKDEKGYLLLDSDGQLIKTIDVDFEGSGQVFTLDKDDNMYIFTLDIKPIESSMIVDASYQLVKMDLETGITEKQDFFMTIEGTVEDIQDKMIVKMLYDDDSLYLLKSNGAIEKYNGEYGIEMIYDKQSASDFVIDKEGDIFYLSRLEDVDIPTTAITKINPETGDTLVELKFEDKLGLSSLVYDSYTDRIYQLSEGSIYSYDSELENEAMVLDMNQLSEFQFSFGFVITENSNIYAMLYKTDKMRIVFYGDADEATITARENEVDSVVLTMQVLLDFNGVYRKTATAFEKENPGIKIEIVEFGKVDSKEYIEKLNLKMMTGDGADIFMSDFPEVTFSQKGYLLALDEMINNDPEFDITDYNANIIENSRLDDELYVFPVRYYYYANVINQKLLQELGATVDSSWDLDDFETVLDIVESSESEAKVFDQNFQGDIMATFLINLDKYIDYENKVARFNDEKFKRSLEVTKRIKDGDFIDEDVNIYTTFQGLGEGRNNIIVFPFYLANYALNAPFELFEDSFEIWKSPGDDGIRMGAIKVGINSSTEYPVESWEFIKFLISPKGQEISELNGFSINNDYRTTMVDVYNTRIEAILTTFPDARYILDEEVAALEELDKMIGNKMLMENILYESIKEEIFSYLDGEKSLEDVIDTIQNKVTLYLNE